MPKIVELRQDRSFMRSNFDGYKLSLDVVAVLRQDHAAGIPTTGQTHLPPRIAKPADNQYSLLHVELFSTQNLLQADPWEYYTTYYISCRGEIVRCNYDDSAGRPDVPQVVFNLGSNQYVKGDYNYSIRFVSEKYCVVCDGMRQVYLLDTGDRRKTNEWKEVAHATISSAPDEPNFKLYDCRLDIIQEQKQISLALGCIQHETAKDDGDCGGSSHFMRVHWAHWQQKDSSTWDFEIVESLESKGSVYYCAFEPRAESLIISSNRDFHFKSQRENESMTVDEVVEKPQLHDDGQFNYAWTQTAEDLCVEFQIEEGKMKSDYSINSTSDSLSVRCGSEILLEETLFARIDEDLTTWTIENNLLEITLSKQTSSCWPSLLQNGGGPKEGTTSIPIEQPIPNLEAPIEDCDFPIGSMEYEVKIERFYLPTKTVTHTVLLGNTPPLFSTYLRAGFPMAIATRQDVDACLWLQQYNPSKPDEWSLRHEGNLHAFGYVQASKQQKKFMDCAPDMSYAVIAESFRHVFLYKMNYDTANGLRNRNGPQVTLGKQHLITLEDAGEVVGMATAPNVVTLLTEKCVLYLQIN